MAAPLQQPISEHSIPLLHPFVKPALLLTCSRWTLVQRPRGSIVTLAKGVFYSFRRWPLPSEQRTRVRCEHEVSSTPFYWSGILVGATLAVAPTVGPGAP